MDVDKDTFHRIINTIADPIFVKDRRHRWVLLNDACCALIGHSREELIGKSDYEFFPKEQADIFWQKDEEVFKSGEENLNEEDITDSSGVVHTIVTKKTRLVDSDGHTFIVGIIRDISDSKRMETSQLELARSQAEREQLELFAYVASHDLREPLQSIIGFGDLIRSRYSKDLDEHGQAYLKRILDASTRMSQLIDDLLRFSRVVRSHEHFTTVDLTKIFRDILEDCEFLIEKKKAKIHIGKIPTIFGDETQIRQLFQNLILNAIKFHAPDQTPEVTVLCQDQGDHLEISVRDNGIGIEEKNLTRIFKPFEKLHHRKEFAGSGVGLAICQKIANYHGGRIHVKSQLGHGSTFFVVLPKKSHPPKN